MLAGFVQLSNVRRQLLRAQIIPITQDDDCQVFIRESLDIGSKTCRRPRVPHPFPAFVRIEKPSESILGGLPVIRLGAARNLHRSNRSLHFARTEKGMLAQCSVPL